MVKQITFSKQEDSQAKVLTVKIIDSPTGIFYTPMNLLKSETFKDTTNALFDGAQSLVDIAVSKLETLNLTGWRQDAKNVIALTIQDPFKKMINAGVQRMTDLKNRHNDWLNMQNVEPFKASEIRQMIRSLKNAEAAVFVLGSTDASTVALKDWDLTGLPNSLRESVEKTLIINNLTERYAGTLKNEPSLNDPLAYGKDVVNARKKASEALAAYEVAQNEIETVRSVISNTVKFVSAIVNVNENVAYEMLTSQS